jgi:hypothetical protein
MKQLSFSVCLASSAVAVFSFLCLGTPTPQAKALNDSEKKKAAEPIVVSADTLAQAVLNDMDAAVKKYHLQDLQVDGVVSRQSEDKGRVVMIQFNVMVKDRKTDKMVEFTVFCGLKDPLPKDDKRLADLAVGKKVTVQGWSGAMGNGQVTLVKCVILRADDKAKKSSPKP